MADWSVLPRDLLVSIARLLSSYEDFFAFRGVCISWRSAATKRIYKGAKRSPWLMLAGGYINHRDFNIPSSLEKIRLLVLPEALGKQWFSSQGWLLVVKDGQDMELVHPFLGVNVELPSVNELRENGCFINAFSKIAISSSPAWTSDYVVMATHGWNNRLAYFTSGGVGWTKIAQDVNFVSDVVFYKGKFYALTNDAKLFVVDIGGPNPTEVKLVMTLDINKLRFPTIQQLDLDGIQRAPRFNNNPFYLVESSGVLLVVVMYRTQNLCYGNFNTTGFKVFEVNVSNEEWSEVMSLGNRAMFLGFNSSVSVEITDSNGCKADCIYFINDTTYVDCVRRGSTDASMGIYNMSDGSVETYAIHPPDSHIAPPPIWVEYNPLDALTD